MYKWLLLLLLTDPLLVNAQQDSVATLTSDTLFYKCGFSRGFVGRNVISDVDTIEEDVDDIFLRQFKILFAHINSFPPVRFQVRNSTEHETHAWVTLVQSGTSRVLPFKSVLFYNPDSINNVVKKYGVSFELWGIIIHEICHLVRQDAFFKEESVKCETAADRYLGFQARALFADVNQAIAAVDKLVHGDTDGYPTKAERIRIIQRGWEDADPLRIRMNSPVHAFVNQNNRFNPSNRIKKNNEFARGEIQVEGNWQSAKISKFPTGKFFITEDAELVFQDDDGVLTIGEVKKSLLAEFEYCVIDKYFQQLFIKEGGEIYVIQDREPALIGKVTSLIRDELIKEN
jgi:hypothetical protein